MRILKVYGALIMMSMCMPITSEGYDFDTVHPEINMNAVSQSKLDYILKNRCGFFDGITTDLDGRAIREWVREGGRMEDQPEKRGVNHFHDPLEDWDDAGLSIVPFSLSSFLWAAQFNQAPIYYSGGVSHSWFDARNSFWLGLTSKTETERETNFAECFQNIGHVMHLVSDLSVPAHVRDDSHYPDWPLKDPDPYELWTESQVSKDPNNLVYTGPNSNYDTSIFGRAVNLEQYPIPISALWDQDQYTGTNPEVTWSDHQVGLAEFTNANFFSSDSIVSIINSYDHPSLYDINLGSIDLRMPESVLSEDGKVDPRIYIRRIVNGEEAYKLYSQSFLGYDCMVAGHPELGPPVLDDEVHRDYADELVPRAVGYSANLLDYFFRGDMKIRKASAKLGSGMTIAGMNFEVKNDTFENEDNQIIEPFKAGVMDISCQYYLDGQEDPQYNFIQEIYTIAESDVSDKINSEFVPISVTFPEEEIIPYGAIDISFTLIFRGMLGKESGAVVARQYVFNENSRIAYAFQPGGSGNESNIFTIAPDGTDSKQITNSVYSDRSFYSSPSWSPDGAKLAFSKELCTDPDPSGECSGEYWSMNIDLIDLTSTENYPVNYIRNFSLPSDSGNWAIGPALWGASFSPDGNQLVAIATGYARWDGALVVFETASGAWHFINNWEYWTNKSVKNSPPAWSPTGDKIAYHVYEENVPDIGYVLRQDICLINPDGTEDQWLTYDNYNNAYPAWSPDGNWIIFVSDRDGEGYLDIWIMDPMGQNMQKVRDCGPDCYSPTFSPDGLKIAFKQGEDIYTINLDGSDFTRVTFSGYYTGQPVWSPVLPEPREP
ncbi:hypothetical protein PITCH_A230154 [uncultured Desulfobacterium sp.]|uniref:Uncharacterized protein n=1 Tax=uncultured Desulfobacterium sp. TaxID=201089 RepID=A0A445MYC2_9BACT|nr:hypothetical protein PITCH_A230154 [uncultured Desulfobacterium sp.]